jgi:8-oxo-dGTP diphosphatase
VMIVKSDNLVLMGLRHGSHGADEWCFPGGGLELGETLEQAAIREVKEETDLQVDNLELIAVADELKYLKSDAKHYVVIGFKADYQGDQVVLREPNKFKTWQWFDLNDLPENIFEGTKQVIERYNKGLVYLKLNRKMI